MDKYGLVDDMLLVLHNNINEKLNKKCLKIENFINNGQMLLTKNINQYNEYKKLFEHDKNIMSVQITYNVTSMDYNIKKLVCINILESIPIYYHSKYFLNNTVIVNEIDVNSMRYNIIGPKCSICKICNNCCRLTNRWRECKICKIYRTCLKCRNQYGRLKNEYWNKQIYSDNSLEYIKALEDIITSESITKKNESENTNILTWSNIVNSQFTDNINLSLNKIVDLVIQNDNNITKYYNSQKNDLYHCIVDKMIACCDGPIIVPITTYYGFINLKNILQ
jgi:hypothetical protein